MALIEFVGAEDTGYSKSRGKKAKKSGSKKAKPATAAIEAAAPAETPKPDEPKA